MNRLLLVATLVVLALSACVQQHPGTTHDAPRDLMSQTEAGVRIHEIRIDQPSEDVDEYVELAGASGTDLSDLTYLVIGDGAGGSGVVEAVVDLTGSTIPASGFFVVAESTFTLGTADLTANLNFENSDNVTHLLVRDFSGANGQDLDGNDDGTLDTTPWSELVDSVALIESTSGGEEVYSANRVGPDGSFVPAHVYRCEDGWRIGSFGGGEDTPGAANACGDHGQIGVCGDAATPISTIQGDGFASPLVGELVVIEGIVVGDFQAGDGDAFDTDLRGFHVQEEVADQDGDPATSEGIFVFAPDAPDVRVGDIVRVRGSVDEYFDLTEITDVTDVLVCGQGTQPAPTPLTLPLTDAEREAVEGMLVAFPQELTISEYFNFDRYGEIVLALPNPDTEDRQFTPTSFVEPGAAANAEAQENAMRRIMLDDGRSVQNPDPARHPNGREFDLGNRFRGADVVADVVGVMDYSFGLYRIQPTGPATYLGGNPRPPAHEAVGGDVKVATFNVLNYFLTVDLEGDICGPGLNQDCRGADSPEEFERQRAKILAALTEIEADVYGLIEMENTTGVEPLADLVSGLNDVFGAGTYESIDTGTIGTDAIRVGFIYKATTVTPVGSHAILDSTVDPRFDDDKNRPVLAQSFAQNSDGAIFTAAVNHLKSKGSDCNDLGDPDLGDGQGNCNLTREAAAQALADWLATDPTGSGDGDFLILGDLNSYDEEDPIDALKAAGFVDLGEAYQGEYAYTYVFDGQFGHLDYAMANATMASQVTGATNWHINADEPDILDYDLTFKPVAQVALYEPNPFRSSDHDPVIVGLGLSAAPVCSGAVPSRSSLWPPRHFMVGVEIEGVTDPDGDELTIAIDSIYQDEPVDLAGDSDGNTAPDGAGIGTSTAEVRAERIEDGNGRVYHIGFTATDAFGAACTGTVEVGVPSNLGRNGAAVDDGALFDSTLAP